jgi:hypothetical protein
VGFSKEAPICTTPALHSKNHGLVPKIALYKAGSASFTRSPLYTTPTLLTPYRVPVWSMGFEACALHMLCADADTYAPLREYRGIK